MALAKELLSLSMEVVWGGGGQGEGKSEDGEKGEESWGWEMHF